MTLYFTLKTIHIISATLLFGTGLGSAYYFWRAHLNGNLNAIAITTKHVVTADWIFTSTSGIMQLVTGISMVLLLPGISFTNLWIWLSIILYFLAGACWLPVVWLQIRMRDMAKQAAMNGTALPNKYYKYMRIWFILGWPAFISLIIVFFLMVFKPV
jgi:uncharacterized membrane protein